MTFARDGLAVVNVHDSLRRAILDGDIAAGSATTQAALAERFEAGRTPLREALRMLQREGLVESEPGRRVRIASLSAEDAEELYTMRIALEAVAARITVPVLSADDLAEMEGLMARMDHYMKSNDTVDAAADGDADCTAERLVRHYLHTVRLIFDQLDPAHDLARIPEAVATVAPGASSAL